MPSRGTRPLARRSRFQGNFDSGSNSAIRLTTHRFRLTIDLLSYGKLFEEQAINSKLANPFRHTLFPTTFTNGGD